MQLYKFLGDDCYISFRYAEHLAKGYGLVWNVGEYVEGYTHLSWVLLLALGIKLGVSPETFSIILGASSGLTVLFLLIQPLFLS